MKKYAMIQIDADIHTSLKNFCNDRGLKIGKLVEALIKDKISITKKPLPTNILPTKT